jgi:hypothetical protein
VGGVIVRCVIVDHDVTVGGAFAVGNVILRGAFAMDGMTVGTAVAASDVGFGVGNVSYIVGYAFTVRRAFAVRGMARGSEVVVGLDKVLGMFVPAFVALRAGLAAVNVVQAPYNAVQAITNAHMAANPVGLVIVAIAVLAVGLVLAYNKLKPFYDAVNTAFVLLKACA